MARSPIVATVMGIIPFVNIYLLYKWFEELKAAKKLSGDLVFFKSDSPIVWTILMLVPIVNFYIIYKLMDDVEKAALGAKQTGYPLGVIPLFVVLLIASMFLFGLPMLYLFYRTQEMMNSANI